MKTKEQVRDEMVAELAQYRLEGMFGDGQNDEYVLYGFPKVKGLREMTDEELLDEFYSNWGPEDLEEGDELTDLHQDFLNVVMGGV